MTTSPGGGPTRPTARRLVTLIAPVIVALAVAIVLLIHFTGSSGNPRQTTSGAQPTGGAQPTAATSASP